MGKTAIIYNTKYGSTEQYAKWISEETGADIYRDKNVKLSQLMEYDTIVFGGPIHAGGLQGLKFLQKNMKRFSGKRVMAFAVGLGLDNENAQQQCLELNFLKSIKEVPCYFMKGAYNPEMVKGIDKTMMGFVKKVLNGKSEDQLTKEDKELLLAINEGADYVDRKYIEDIVEAIKEE